ncbi:MAG TPA: hypothetical protein VJ302_26265 [Blastocatellia bacterium]|nr:hypothetical protein [Blastocatellia bacterium]
MMYTAAVMTEHYRVVQKGERFEYLEDAKKAARQLVIQSGQMFAVIDETNLVHWKGGVIKNTNRQAKSSSGKD